MKRCVCSVAAAAFFAACGPVVVQPAAEPVGATPAGSNPRIGGSGPEGSAYAGSGASFDPAADEYLVAEQPYTVNWLRGYIGKQTVAPSPAGEASFLMLHNGGTLVTKHFFRIRHAAAADLQPGALLAAFDADMSKGYRQPKDRTEALKIPWFLARVVNNDDLGRGQVLTAAGLVVNVAAAWVIDGDASPRGNVSGSEDRQFLHPDHYLVGDAELPEKDWRRIFAAVAIQPPSAATKGEGQMLMANSGNVLWTKHAWRTRLADPKDLVLGAHVYCLDARDHNGLFRNPENRREALGHAWFVAKITDTSELFKNVVTLGGNFKANIDALRVVVP